MPTYGAHFEHAQNKSLSDLKRAQWGRRSSAVRSPTMPQGLSAHRGCSANAVVISGACMEVTRRCLRCHCDSTALLIARLRRLYGVLIILLHSFNDCTELSQQSLHSQCVCNTSIGICMTNTSKMVKMYKICKQIFILP